MTVKEIIKKHLTDNGFDGLYRNDCGCCLPDLIPCDYDIGDCIPGYKHTHSVSGSWLISGDYCMTDEEIVKFIDEH